MPMQSGPTAFKSIGSIPLGNPLKLGLLAVLLAGCAPKPANATQNTVFTPEETFGPKGPELVAAEPALNDRLASRVLDDQERRAVWATLANMVSGPVIKLVPAADGARFSDVPSAALNAAQSNEMALRSTHHEWFRMSFDHQDQAGRASRLEVVFMPRGPLVGISGDDSSEGARLSRAEMHLAVNRMLVGLKDQSAASVREAITALMQERKAGPISIEEHPEEYRFEMLMLDGQPARLLVVRRPEPDVYSWNAWAGVFPKPERAESLGTSFDRYMHSWGEVPGFPGDGFDPAVSLETPPD